MTDYFHILLCATYQSFNIILTRAAMIRLEIQIKVNFKIFINLAFAIQFDVILKSI